MKKSILFSVLVVGATLLQAQSITIHQTCGQNGQVVEVQAVDLGLSVKWANMNVGAESPEDYGNYYAWGETVTKATYDWSTYFDTNDGGSTFTKYNNEGGKTVLDPEDDAAHVNLGGSWRMPTKAEWQELYDNCTWTWTTQNGINGYKVTSNKEGYTDKFIFLPAAGHRNYSGLRNAGSYGYYWSSSLFEVDSYLARDLYFGSSYHYLSHRDYRYLGRSVRSVLPQTSISYSSSTNDTIRIYSNGCDDYQTFIGSHGGQLTMTANSDQWSHFVRWNDGNTDNPRTITTNGNADCTAYFETYKYSVQVQSNDAARGGGYISKVVKGDTLEYNDSVGSFDAGSEVFLAYQANYGYHFDKWSDGNTSQQRSFILAKDTTFTATFAKNVYTITLNNAEHGSISGDTSAEYLDEVTLTANPDYGYHFMQWSDGSRDNPRTFVLTQDTTFSAEFAKNTYTITTESSNPKWGTTAGDNSALYLDEVEISATANYGYHFVQWDDNNTLNPRSFTLTQDTTFTATFAKNVYSITQNAEHGSISGNSSAEYLDEVTLTANPDYGYHFTQWSDGNKENPRTFVLTQDTTFNAEFAIDKTGTCGDDNALTWTYDAETKTLTITGNGTLNSNYYFGIEAPTQMQKLVIGNEVTAIGDSAFYRMSTINHLIIGGSVATIGNYAFAECRNFDDITCLANVVPVINETTFANVGNKQYIYLFVPEARERAYHRDTYWGEFDIQVQQAEEATVTTTDVTVEPQDNAAIVTWPTNDNAASYTIEITKDGVVFCTLIFNGNGQLTGIAFAPSRDGHAHAPAAVMTANGLQFTVTGLNSATHYNYTLQTKDANDNILASYSGEFTTTGVATAIDNIYSSSLQGGDRGRLIYRDGQIFILRGDKTYTTDGRLVR